MLDITTPLPPDGDDVCPAGGTAPPDDDCVTIYQGVRALRDGLKAVDDVVGEARGPSGRGPRRVRRTRGRPRLHQGRRRPTRPQGAQELYDSLCVAVPPATDPTLDQASCDQIQAVIDAAESALGTAGGALPDIKDLVAAIAALEAQATALSAALDYALASTERLLLGVEAVGLAVGTGTPTQPGLATAMAALNAGLRQLSAQLTTSQAELNKALTSVADGSEELATGIDGAATGADALADGSGQLADGAEGAATGAEELADGQQQLADGAQDAASGADQLSTGLSGLAEGADSAASAGQDLAGGRDRAASRTAPHRRPRASSTPPPTPALAQAWLEATAARASDALPYGPPVGAAGQRRLRVQPRRGPRAALASGSASAGCSAAEGRVSGTAPTRLGESVGAPRLRSGPGARAASPPPARAAPPSPGPGRP